MVVNFGQISIIDSRQRFNLVSSLRMDLVSQKDLIYLPFLFTRSTFFFVMLDEMFAYDVLGAHVRLSDPVLTNVAKFLPSFSSFYSSFQLLNLSHQLLHLSIFMSSFNLPLHNFSIKYVINYIVIILVSDNSC